MRKFIIATFEEICLGLVVLPTGIALFIAAYSTNPTLWVLISVAVFLVGSFLAGGALTLIEIAKNTRWIADDTKSIIRALRGELQQVADDVHRMRGQPVPSGGVQQQSLSSRAP